MGPLGDLGKVKVLSALPPPSFVKGMGKNHNSKWENFPNYYFQHTSKFPKGHEIPLILLRFKSSTGKSRKERRAGRQQQWKHSSYMKKMNSLFL